MIKNVKKLLVKYNNRFVGTLFDDDGVICFQYGNEWIENGFSISPITLPLSKKIYRNKNQVLDGLFGVFHDSLPDGWGNLLLRRKLSNVGVDYSKLSPLTKLSLVGKNGLGGLEYEPLQAENTIVKEYNLDKLSKEAKDLINCFDSNIDIDTISALGGASGGSRPKVHIKDEEAEWIVKFPCRYDPNNIGCEEYRMNLLARKAGINTNEFKLFESKINKGYFGAKRFDRKNNKKVHMVSLSSLLETSHLIPNLDYLILFQVINKICIEKSDILEAYKRMCFNVIVGNKDDHGKNFAFLYDEEKKGYTLSPFYDITSLKSKLEHEMTVNRKGNPKENDIIGVGLKAGLSLKECEDTLESIKNIVKTHK